MLDRSIRNLTTHINEKNIRRILKSMMFLKKLLYKNEFEAYAQVDYIVIKKLRSASLREQIKLMSITNFEIRLTHFLNIFKFLVISNYEEIFGYLVENKSADDLAVFIDKCIFMLPNSGSAVWTAD
jgi:hypothetical protein